MELTRIHPDFKFNGVHYNYKELHKVAQDLRKTNQPFENEIGLFFNSWISSNPMIEVSTSGSTGTPKKILLKKESMVNSALATGDFLGLIPKNKALHCLPTKFIAGKMMLVRAMVLGLEIDCVSPGSNPLSKIESTYDFCAMIPLQVENSLGKLNLITKLIVGGAKPSNKLIDKIQKTTVDVYETYGMTETISHIALKKISKSKEDYFTILPNIFIANDNRNCLVISASKLQDKPVVTNDIVEIINDKQFKWLGRFDSIVNSGGVKLIPEEIEQTLAKVIAKPFFVAGILDDILGQKLVLVIESDDKISDLEFKIVENKSLSKFQKPKEIFYLPKFTLTENGKINRKSTIALLNL